MKVYMAEVLEDGNSYTDVYGLFATAREAWNYLECEFVEKRRMSRDLLRVFEWELGNPDFGGREVDKDGALLNATAK